MKLKTYFTLTILIILLTTVATAQNQPQGKAAAKPPAEFNTSELKQVGAQPQALTVNGGGSAGRLSKWVGSSGASSVLGDSLISESKVGNIGVGTDTPNSKLTVAGVIESSSGGIKFPDGTVQTTAFTQQSSSAPLQPFSHELAATFGAGQNFASASFTVPAGKSLVIETVSLLVSMPFGENFDSFTIATTVKGQTIYYNLFPTQIYASGNSISRYGVTQPLKIYADPGTPVLATIARPFNSLSGPFGFSLQLAGYLVDVP